MTVAEQKILHLVTDQKFVDRAYREFELIAPGVNDFVYLGDNIKFSHIKSAVVRTLSVAGFSTQTDFSRYSAVVFHSLPNPELLEVIPEGTRVLWIGWGYDYYSLLLARAFPHGVTLPETLRLAAPVPSGRLKRLVSKAAGIVPALKRRRRRDRHRRAVTRVDYFSPVIPTEFEMAVSLNAGFDPQYIPWNYGTVEDDLQLPGDQDDSPALDLLVGNSATPTNNHVEVFRLLKECFDLSGRRIFVPMSYGREDYREKILALGREYFDEQFVPLLDFMPLDEYKEIISSCGFVFMNHLRQQGYANISGMLLKGARIYMNPASPLYQWLTREGVCINSMEDMGMAGGGKKLPLLPLAAEERDRNYDFVMGERSREAQREKTRSLVEILLR